MSVRKPNILIIDDDKEIASLIKSYLIDNGFKVTSVQHGMQWRSLLRDNNFDVLVLDIMLPGENGLNLCRMIREEYDLPIIMLSAANTSEDRVLGLELGADDYIDKPFRMREFLARINSQLRRTQGSLSQNRQTILPTQRIKFSNWRLNRGNQCLIDKDNIAYYLSPREYNLLLVFLENSQRILSRSQLMDLLYDKDFNPFDRSIDVLISRLRKKIEVDPKNPILLITVRGGGYQLQAQVTIDE